MPIDASGVLVVRIGRRRTCDGEGLAADERWTVLGCGEFAMAGRGIIKTMDAYLLLCWVLC